MLPDSERTRIPVGSYKFQIMKEPDARRKTGQSGKGFTTILFILKATNEAGETFDHMESILAFEERYDDLLLVLGATDIKGRLSGKTIEPVGMMFNAEIVHEPDKNDPRKSWARMVNIRGLEEGKPEPVETLKDTMLDKPDEDDDVPF